MTRVYQKKRISMYAQSSYNRDVYFPLTKKKACTKI